MHERNSCFTISPIRDKLNRRILLLHSDALPTIDHAAQPLAQFDPAAHHVLQTLTSNDVLIYLHAGLASTSGTTAWGVRAFRRALDACALHDHQIPAECLAVHVSFVSRAHASVAARFAGAFTSQLYAKMRYCDLLSDLEEDLGVDSTLLGLHRVDFDYDNVMRAWVGRQFDPADGNATTVTDLASQPHSQKLDPSKPLIDVSAISFTTETESEEHLENAEPRMIEEP